MSSFEHLDVLRRQNKELLQKLKLKPGNLHFECSRTQNENTTPEAGTSAENSARDPKERNAGLLNVSGGFMNLTVSGNCLKVARSALCKSTRNRNTSTTGTEMAPGCLTGEEAERVSEDTVYDVPLQERAECRLLPPVNPTRQMKPESVISQEKSQRVSGRVRFPHEDDESESESESESERPRLQPLLGYDWIAGLLDAESSLTERSELFFRELRTFRQVNSEECIYSIPSRLPDAAAPWSPCVEDSMTNQDHLPDSHQCTFCYRINSRLFAVPLDPRAACPVCRIPKEEHPHTENQPAFIRVSIPRATLLPAYHYKAHRRCSFDPSDSLDLPSHCLSGWTNISMGVGYKMSSLDLRTSIEIRPNSGTVPSTQDESQMVPPSGPKPCPPCEPGFIQKKCQCVKCPDGHFWSQMNGQATCNTCTTSCTVKKNLIEVTACTKTTDRRCQCKPGFYCPSPVNLTCRRDCQQCKDGFTSAANLNRTCRLYTDCARVGMFVIKEGSSTADRVCGHQTIRPHILSEMNAVKTLYTPDTRYTPEALYTPDTPDTKTQSLAPSTVKPLDVTSAKSETTAASWLSQPKIAQTDREGPLQPSETLSKTTWIFMFLLLLALCLVSCLFLQCKRRAIKKNLAWAGRAFGRYQPVSATANPHAKTLLPVSDLREARGQGSFPGGNQQVTMEHKGKADGINNTVGSIFIYSPGTVVLGSNSNEKKEETETSGEDAVEDGRLISVPQQESSSERDVRMATQEELGKELSVPVPATSK